MSQGITKDTRVEIKAEITRAKTRDKIIMAMKEEIGRTIKDNKEESMNVIVGLTKI